MSMMSLFSSSRSVALIAAFSAMTALPLCAQQSGLNPISSPLLLAATSAPAASDSYSSSAESAAITPEAAKNMFSEATQPPPRRRYGRPTYHDANSNGDGSRKYSFFGAAGFAMPSGSNSNYLTTSYGIEFGGGRNFNHTFGLMLRGAYDHFKMTNQTISNQSLAYFGDATNPYGLDGNSHIWSISLDPVVNFKTDGNLGAYVTGGVGFYHKVANFTIPQTTESCVGYYGCYYFTSNQNVDHYMSNAIGFDGGFGLTYKLSRFSSEQLFAEARYVHINNQYKQPDINNYFPQNSQKTDYIPVKFGIRF